MPRRARTGRAAQRTVGHEGLVNRQTAVRRVRQRGGDGDWSWADSALWATSALNARDRPTGAGSGQALQQAADVRFLVADLNARERLVVIATAKQDTAVITAETRQSRTNTRQLKRHDRRARSDRPQRRGDEKPPASTRRCGRGPRSGSKTAQFAKAMQALEAAESTDAARQHSEHAADLASGIEESMAAQFATDRAGAAAI